MSEQTHDYRSIWTGLRDTTFEQGFVNGDERAVGLEVLTLNARAGDDDRIAGAAVRRRRIQDVGFLRHRRGGGDDEAAGATGQQQGLESPVYVESPHFVLPSQVKVLGECRAG